MLYEVITLLAMILACSLFAGCQQTGTDTNSTNTADSNDKTADEQHKLVVWCWDMGFNGATMEKAADVITSYSIHYTKLYDLSTSLAFQIQSYFAE